MSDSPQEYTKGKEWTEGGLLSEIRSVYMCNASYVLVPNSASVYGSQGFLKQMCADAERKRENERRIKDENRKVEKA
jgi:hypothetical protein